MTIIVIIEGHGRASYPMRFIKLPLAAVSYTIGKRQERGRGEGVEEVECRVVLLSLVYYLAPSVRPHTMYLLTQSQSTYHIMRIIAMFCT